MQDRPPLTGQVLPVGSIRAVLTVHFAKRYQDVADGVFGAHAIKSTPAA